MFSDLAQIRAELKTRLEPFTGNWRIVDRLEKAGDTVVPVVYFTYDEISSAVNGQPLDRHTVAPRITLTLASAGTADEDAVDAQILHLAHVLQGFDDIYWDTATKVSLDSGAYAWRVALTILSILPTTPAVPGQAP